MPKTRHAFQDRPSGLGPLMFAAARGVPSLVIPDSYWMGAEDGPEDGPADRLLATVVVNGVDFLFDARAVMQGRTGQSFAAVGDGTWMDYDRLQWLTGAEGPFPTVTIRGRQYVVFAAPSAP